MKYTVPVPKRIKIGGFDYSIRATPFFDKELYADGDKGQYSSRLRRIILSSTLPLTVRPSPPKRFSIGPLKTLDSKANA